MKIGNGLKKSSKGYYIRKRDKAQLQHTHKTHRISRLTPFPPFNPAPIYKPHTTQSIQRGANIRKSALKTHLLQYLRFSLMFVLIIISLVTD